MVHCINTKKKKRLVEWMFECARVGIIVEITIFLGFIEHIFPETHLQNTIVT